MAQKASTTGKADLVVADGLSSNTKYVIKLAVQDKGGLVGYASQNLTVGNCPPTAVMAILPTATLACDGAVTVDGTGSSDSDGTVASYSWKLVYGNQTVTKSGVTATVSYTADKLVSGATYAVTLTVKDNLGSSGTANGVLTVQAGCVVVNKPPNCAAAVPSVKRISTLVSALQPASSSLAAQRRFQIILVTHAFT